jgi:glyoxylase-like metal-dependent hydrolase (beta-lactamase superfamily II)/8-oxo-dGTP pyrophosphatase MutT (NUDIX family)
VFWVLRGANVGFAGGFRAFPGGRLDPEDALLAIPGLEGEAAALAACAARELFEETGVLLARGAAALGYATRVNARRELLDGTRTFAAFLAEHGLAVDAARLAPAGRWVTPDALPLRYDARLFLVPMPDGEEAEVWEGELVHGEFIPAREALARWERGETLLHPPNLHAIRTLAAAAPDEALPVLRSPPRMDARSITDWVEFQRGVFYVPLRTPTLPPAAHTNAWILDVGGGVAVVDPGSPWPEEQARLDDVLAAHAAQGRPAREVWLTHEHQDHVGGAAHLAGRLGAPVRAHAECIARLPPAARALARPIADGELLHGRWRALHTPGHARGHLVFHDERTGALLCGDLVSTLSTIVIDPPEGDMGAYLRSLARVRALAPLRALYPAHGSPAPDAGTALDGYLAHRRARAAKVEAALAAGPATLEGVTRRAYDDTPAALHGLAARSCLATLEWLAAEGRAVADGERWRAVEASAS